MSEAVAAIDAAKAGDLPRLRELLAADASLANARDAEQGWPILLWAAMYGFSGRTTSLKPVVDLLLTAGAEADIFAAAYLNRPEDARSLLHEDASRAQAADEQGWTPLHHAAERGAAEVARLLLDAGANPNARNAAGQAPIHCAAHAGPWKPHPAADVIALLKERGAEIDAHLAAALGDAAQLQALIAADAAISACS